MVINNNPHVVPTVEGGDPATEIYVQTRNPRAGPLKSLDRHDQRLSPDPDKAVMNIVIKVKM